MANLKTAQRGTDWRRVIASPGFRAGFADARAGTGFRAEFDRRPIAWQWWYEYGRLFACSAYSRRWKTMPERPRDVPWTLAQACANARRVLDIPPTGVSWQ